MKCCMLQGNKETGEWVLKKLGQKAKRGAYPQNRHDTAAAAAPAAADPAASVQKAIRRPDHMRSDRTVRSDQIRSDQIACQQIMRTRR